MGSSYARNLFYSAVALVGTVLGVVGIAYTSPGFFGYVVLAMVVVMTILASLAFGGVLPLEGILKFVPGFRPNDPQSIRESHHENIIKRIMEDFGASLPSEQIKASSKYSVKCQGRLCARAKRCKVRADMHWGRPSSRRRFKAAWLYVSAADIYCLAGKPAEAGDLYHWAANTFRELESYERAIEYYLASSNLADAVWRVRCLQRAMGVARSAGDFQREADLRAEISRLTAPAIPS
jgi:hypothetical protein